MQVRLQGFAFYPGNVIKHKDFIEHLLKCSGKEFLFQKKKRVFHFKYDTKNNHYIGVLVTIQNHKNICTLEDKKISILTPGLKGRLMEFNYFIFDKDSYKAIYQTYHHACSLNVFGTFLKERWFEFRDTLIQTEIVNSNIQGSNDIFKFRIKREKEYGDFTIAHFVKQEEFKSLLGELDRISSFEYGLETLEEEENEHTPASEYALRKYKRIVFRRKAPLNAIVDSLAEFISNKGIETGKIKGYDPAGTLRAINLLENPDYYEEYGLDDVILRIEGKDIDDLENNWVIETLVNTAKKVGLKKKAA